MATGKVRKAKAARARNGLLFPEDLNARYRYQALKTNEIGITPKKMTKKSESQKIVIPISPV